MALSRNGWSICLTAGLTICKTIIQAHQGEIHARNHENGAEFYFSLPLEEENGGVKDGGV